MESFMQEQGVTQTSQKSMSKHNKMLTRLAEGLK